MTDPAPHDGPGRSARDPRSASGAGPASSLLAAVATVDALRERDAWYAAQTHATLARYALEEGHEVAAAAETVEASGARGTMDALRDELGDLLLQVLLHARLAAEREDGFDLADVAAALVAKARRRHPHVFAADGADSAPAAPATGGADTTGGARGPSVAELEAGWEALKDADRAGRHPLDDLPAALPALVRAQKVLAVAERAGVRPVAPLQTPARRDEVGPALLALADAARRAGLDAEQELRTTVHDLENAARAASAPPQR